MTAPEHFADSQIPLAVKLGLVAVLARPGGNLTGVNFFFGELLAKRLDLLRELVPTARRIAVLVNPANPQRADVMVKEVQTEAQAIGMDTRILSAGTADEITSPSQGSNATARRARSRERQREQHLLTRRGSTEA